MVWCVFWFAPAIFSLTGLVILVRHGLCATRLLAKPPLTARWIVPERVRATRRFPIAWTTVSRFCLTRHSFSPCANLKACAGFRLINYQSHSGEWSRDVGDTQIGTSAGVYVSLTCRRLRLHLKRLRRRKACWSWTPLAGCGWDWTGDARARCWSAAGVLTPHRRCQMMHIGG
jgi:hypothetical protein